MKGFFLPKDLSERLIDVVADAIRAKKMNTGLFFDKCVLWWRERDELKCNPKVQIGLLKKIYINFQEIKGLLESSGIAGRKLAEKITEDVELSLPFGFFFPLDEYRLYKKRINNLLSILEQMGYHVEYLPGANSGLPLSWRLIINLGAASVYETSLLFHRNYSVPYIPGSAVKGVANHYAIMLKEEGKVTNEEHRRIFGDQNRKGEVIFFDALPIPDDENKDFVVLDVMNVHYREYYQDESGRTPPGDWMNPNPVFFLAVEKGTKFMFTVASRDENLAKKAIELLKEAVERIGIGAKTSAGYGYFDVKLDENRF